MSNRCQLQVYKQPKFAELSDIILPHTYLMYINMINANIVPTDTLWSFGTLSSVHDSSAWL